MSWHLELFIKSCCMNVLADLMGEEGPTGPRGQVGGWQVKRGWASLVSIESPLVLFAARWACPPQLLWNSGDIPMWSVLSSQLTHRNPFSALPPPTLSPFRITHLKENPSPSTTSPRGEMNRDPLWRGRGFQRGGKVRVWERGGGEVPAPGPPG